MKLTPLLLGLFICTHLIVSSSVSTLSSPRRLASASSPRLLADPSEDRQMLHIDQLVDMLNDYELKVATGWQPYADLKSTFELSFSQYVIINIRIAIAVNVPCKMKLRVTIDGFENKQLRREVGQSKFIVLIPSEYVWLGKGKHTIQVQFIKTGSDQTIQNNRINMALLKLSYLNRKQPLRQPKTIFVQTSYPISLIKDNKWYPFPDLKVNFKLEAPTEVAISYKTGVWFDGQQSAFVTRLMIDGKQNQLFTYHTGILWWAVNFASYTVQLQPGFHQIRVQYRTPGNVVRVAKHDWNRNHLLVKY